MQCEVDHFHGHKGPLEEAAVGTIYTNRTQNEESENMAAVSENQRNFAAGRHRIPVTERFRKTPTSSRNGTDCNKINVLDRPQSEEMGMTVLFF